MKMTELKKTLGAMGFENVKTVIASGNVYFEVPKSEGAALATKIERKFHETFGFEIPTMIRRADEIKKIVESDPFKNIKVTDMTRLYVTFLKEKHTSKLAIPYSSPTKEFQILKVTKTELFSVLQLIERGKTPEAMNIIEKEFGKQVTTRNWNTVVKMANL